MSVTDPKPHEVAAQRYTETLVAGGEAIAYHGEANADASDPAGLKAEAAARRALDTANKTVAAAAHVTIGMNTLRGELKAAEDGFKSPEDAADVARTVIDIARRAAAAAAAAAT